LRENRLWYYRLQLLKGNLVDWGACTVDHWISNINIDLTYRPIFILTTLSKLGVKWQKNRVWKKKDEASELHALRSDAVSMEKNWKLPPNLHTHWNEKQLKRLSFRVDVLPMSENWLGFLQEFTLCLNFFFVITLILAPSLTDETILSFGGFDVLWPCVRLQTNFMHHDLKWLFP